MSYEMGEFGGAILSAGDTIASIAPGETFRALQIVNDTVLAAITVGDVTNSADLVGPILPAGLVLLMSGGGGISALTVTSGVVYLIK